MSAVHGIAGIRGREPVGAALTIGVKKAGTGYPVDKDRFHIVQPREVDGARPYLPQFSAFNTAAPDQRRFIRGNIVHPVTEDCFEYHLKNQVGPNGAHPNRRPFCVGDGNEAIRWLGGDPENFKTIQCPHDKCEFRQKGTSKGPACKPWMRFLFRVRWKDGSPLPTPLVKYTSGAWNTVSNFVGFFEYLDNAAGALRLASYSLAGLPFTLQLIEQTKPSAKSRFPVVVISPEMDPIEFFREQRESVAQLSGPAPIALPEPAEQDNGVIAGDYETVGVPGQ